VLKSTRRNVMAKLIAHLRSLARDERGQTSSSTLIATMIAIFPSQAFVNASR
jgi:hypothetical protein